MLEPIDDERCEICGREGHCGLRCPDEIWSAAYDDDDRPCPCKDDSGHTVAEHGYDPDSEE